MEEEAQAKEEDDKKEKGIGYNDGDSGKEADGEEDESNGEDKGNEGILYWMEMWAKGMR